MSDNPQLLQLYKDLVITQVTSVPVHDKDPQRRQLFMMLPLLLRSSQLRSSGLTTPPSTSSSRLGSSKRSGWQVGLVLRREDLFSSGSFLAEIKPQADGANGGKSSLSIHQSMCRSQVQPDPGHHRVHLQDLPRRQEEACGARAGQTQRTGVLD